MAPPGPSLTSQARAAELNAATAARARSMGGELGDISELPSAQPISLGELTMRSHSRNKGSKSWKPFMQENMPSQHPGLVEAFRRPHRPVDRFYPPIAAPGTAYPAPQPHVNPQVPYYNHAAYPVPDYQYPMYQGMYYYQQMYPSQMAYYPPVYATPTPQPLIQSPSPAMGPSRRQQEAPAHRFVPQDMSPTKQEEDMIRSKSAATEHDDDNQQVKGKSSHTNPCGASDVNIQDHLSPIPTPGPAMYLSETEDEDSIMSEPWEFQPGARDSYQNPPRLSQFPPISEKNRPSTPQSKLQRSNSPLEIQSSLKKHSSIRPENASGAGSDVNHSFKEGRESCLSMVPVRGEYNDIARGGEEDCRDVSATKEQLSPAHAETHGTKFDVNAYLKDVSEASSAFENPLFNLEDPFVPEQQPVVPSGLQSPFQPRGRSPVPLYEPLVNRYENNVFASEESRQEGLAKITTEATWKEFQQGPRRVKVPGVSQSSSSFSHIFETYSSAEKNDAKRFTRAPPGLASSEFGPPLGPLPWAPTASRENHASSYYDRVLEAEDWFHQGNNLQEKLPPKFRQKLDQELEKVLNTNDETVSNTETAARQTVDACQRVMANLYSYNGEAETNKSLGLTNFGPVDDEYCEPTYGGRRSYFDNDPSFRQWRLQTGRLTPSTMFNPYREDILTNFQSQSMNSVFRGTEMLGRFVLTGLAAVKRAGSK